MPGYEGSTSVKWLKKNYFKTNSSFSRNETSRYTDLLPSGKSRQFSFNMMPKSIITEPSFGDKLERQYYNTWYCLVRNFSNKSSSDFFEWWKKLEETELNEKNSNITNFTYSFDWTGKSLLLQSRCIDNKKIFNLLEKNF